ncbi:MAG TPA: tetratricopeptide repeat protein [Bradyrhizobium sp.]|uniref:tetratricopeptide repeat protein n=1 Tax=Bradyrhizobium sp. TaxID=376 RepID=UPI002C12BAA5|nr:tetratricopeptide repeat protein [Bradyrhizobium sp.]HLZ04750.1 tetratricopeptide repeat protein [Bradyrhizobium sp.]
MSGLEQRSSDGERTAEADGSAPSTPQALCAEGFRLRSAGRSLDAVHYCRKALSIDPNRADALHLMGLLSFDEGECDLALAWMARAIRQDPKAEYLKHLGGVLQHVKRYEEALKAFDKAIAFQPDSAELWRSLGEVLLKLDREDEALLSYQRALQLAPGDFDAALKSGVLLHRQGRWGEALAHFNMCEALRPNHAPVLNLRAIAHRGVGDHQGYLSDSLRAHALDPADAESCNNAGDALLSLGREEEAIAWFDKALLLLPDNPTILTNKAQAISQCRCLDEAMAIYSHVRSVAPGHAMAEWNLALLRLLAGDFAAGWAGREARWKIPSLSAGYPKFRQPMWRGEPVAGKTMLIHADEGLGDTIQFARYAPMLGARGARVILVVADALQPLLSELPGVVQCLKLSEGRLPDFDMHCPFSSLPPNFATTLDTIPAATSYLQQPAPERIKAWEERLGPRKRLRVGLVWSGSLAHRNDQNRSIPLNMLARILDTDATFVSLQKDPRPADTSVLAERNEIIDLTAQLTDFAVTAALVSCLDLVVTVDTSVAHLAGALGRPTWIMLPYMPDYRWLLDRGDSPWYPTVRLFRQDAARDYAPVVDRIRAALAAFEPRDPR